jgi:hypothetical protein
MLPRLASELFLTIDNTLASTPLFSLPKRGELMDAFRAELGDDGAVDMRLPPMICARKVPMSVADPMRSTSSYENWTLTRKRPSEEISFR